MVLHTRVVNGNKHRGGIVVTRVVQGAALAFFLRPHQTGGIFDEQDDEGRRRARIRQAVGDRGCAGARTCESQQNTGYSVVRASVRAEKLEAINDVFAQMHKGEIEGRVVLDLAA